MLRVAAAQISPVFLDAAATTRKILVSIEDAARQGVRLVAFGETLLPGYPFWLSSTGGARFDDAKQKAAYAAYLGAAVRVEGPEVTEIVECARDCGVFVMLGLAERGTGRGSGTVYCTALPIDPEQGALVPHRKLVPTYEERLVWGQGDGHGLRVYEACGTSVSVLNCWENWMPLARYALYAGGTRVHVALWPGAVRLTEDVTRFVAREGRVFVLSAGGLLSKQDLPADFALLDALGEVGPVFYDGGSCVAAPTGEFLVTPQAGREGLIVADLDLECVLRERQNFDPAGHYDRPDVFDLRLDRRPRRALHVEDEL